MLFIDNFIHLFTESAPFLLVGMFIAGLIHHAIPQTWITRWLGRDASVATAALIGAPLPLCSCSVIPVALGIRGRGASKASTASFLVATPETGVDSIGITYALMGPIMAIARPVAAIFSAIVTGLSIKLAGNKEIPALPSEESSGCCCATARSNSVEATLTRSSFSLRAVVSYGFGKLFKDFMGWLLIGLFFAALIQTFVPQGFLSEYGSGITAMALMVIVSIPMYICATASTPIAVGLMMSGISPGAALVFMLTGPATNIATLMVVKDQLGNREVLLYLSSVIISACAMGMGLDYLLDSMQWQINVTVGEHSPMTSWLYQLSGLGLAALVVFHYAAKLKAWWPQGAPAR